jgi:FkbM family methyltransferase
VVQDDLIYDVGLHEGIDTRHYLNSGFRVVAVEANPTFVTEARIQFADEIADGRLVIVDSAVGPEAGSVSFWVNDENSEWSSIIESEGARDGTPAHVIEVKCVTFGSVLARYGVPYYLKIDIEGASVHCLEALSPPDLPSYVSIEALTLAYLGMLSRLGYNEFKVIDQRTHRGITRLGRHAYRCRNAVEQVARRVPGAPRAYRALSEAPIMSRHLATPTPRSSFSGPFGESTDGEWRSLDEVAFDYVRFSSAHSWYDFHTRLGTGSDTG